MGAFLTPGVITGILAAIGAITQATGHPALGTFFQDPQTGALVNGLVTGAAALAAGLLKGVKG